ncbi:MAG: DUF3024 domain-containing protein [Steroidobacteraceae bacterium]
MGPTVPPPAAAATQPNEFDRKRIERALAARKRYRYVSPGVRVVEGGYVIESPCCSRNVDRAGGCIDIAMLQFAPGENPWRLYRKDHDLGQWHLHGTFHGLMELLAEVNADPLRLFWQ